MSILQTRISEFEQQHSSVEDRFSRLKEEALTREHQQQEEYSKQMQHLAQEVLRAKREFEEHLQVSVCLGLFSRSGMVCLRNIYRSGFIWVCSPAVGEGGGGV